MKFRFGLIAMIIASVSLAASAPSWDDYWHSIKVDPPPPRSFLDAPAFHGKMLNLTTGRLTDAVVKQWIEADLRRGAADGWTEQNLGRDIADAGVFGPPGLNGTSEGIDSERAKGVARVEADGYSQTVAAAVIWISKEDQRANSSAGYADYVIVHVRRMTGRPRIRIFRNGAREAIAPAPTAGELRWQLDTGHFFTHPVLGPLWYQRAGWRCIPDDGTRMGEICARVRP